MNQDSASPKPTSFRLPDEELEQIDAHARKLRAEQPGVRVTRTDALRSLYLAGLRAERAQAARGEVR